MKIKLLYRSPTIWNIILFMLMSFVFLYLQSGLVTGQSVLDPRFFIFNIQGLYLYLGLLFATILSILFLMADAAKFLFTLNTLSVVLISFMHYYQSQSKFILIVLFLFMISSYYFYQLLRVELSEAYINPNYHKGDLFKPSHQGMTCRLEGKEGEFSYRGHLTNWNTNGCFIYVPELANNIPELRKSIKKLQLVTSIDGANFSSNCRLVCVAEDGCGVGIRVVDNESKNDKLNWKTFETLVSQMGYQVELMK